MAQPITAAAEVVPRDGLRGAVGYGVNLPDTDPIPGSQRWYGPGGYVLEGVACGPGGYTASGEFCDPARDWEEGRGFVTSGDEQHPFVVGASIECSTFGSPSDIVAEYWAKADRALEMAQWALIANELWTGARSTTQGWTNHHLADPAATILSATPVSVTEAVAALEQAFGSCSAGDVQVIHIPRHLVAYLDAAGVIHTTPGSGRIWTANNSLVVADRGYPGTGPDGEEPEDGVYWIYSTGPLTARLGAVKHPERDLADAVAWETNRVAVRSERLAAIDWLCCHLAVPIDLNSDGTVFVPFESGAADLVAAGALDMPTLAGLDWWATGRGN